MVLYGSSYALRSISRKGNSCIKRHFFEEEEMEMLPYQFLAILFLFLDSPRHGDLEAPYTLYM